ncbi:(d)CMP kinase [candidate division WOR-3 bacterium]|nr:(d)CMP kinase [candidate division WOR-3 bacterium]
MILITIDGPAAAGKSTVAKIIAEKLGFLYLDTGAMYRAVTLFLIENGIDVNNETKISSVLDDIEVKYENGRIFLNGKDVENRIRRPDVSEAVSPVSAIPEVRKKMVELQRSIFHEKGIVCEGRDMGSVVFPEAEHKFFMTASLNQRAKRRKKDLLVMGVEMDCREVGEKLSARDKYDSERSISPLKVPEGSTIIDTTELTICQVVEKITADIGL